MTGTCIYCHKNGQMSREHYLPACFGSFKNFEPLYGKLCGECNRKIGGLEEQFCRCGPEAFYRIYLGIKGRKHHEKPSPFYRRSAGGHRIEMKAKHPTRDLEIYCEMIPKTGETVPARQIIVKDQNEKLHAILITDSIQESQDLKKELDYRSIREVQFVESWCDVKEQDLMKKLCSIFKEKIDWDNTAPYHDKRKQLHVATITVNDRYFRTIAKISFHYLLKQFPNFTGFEDEFTGIKDFIMKGDDQEQWVQQVRGSFVGDLKSDKTTTKDYCHLVSIEKNQRKIYSRLQFFVGPKGIPPYYHVFIGNNPEKIIYPQMIGHQFVYFDKPDQGGYIGRMDPMHSITHIVLPKMFQ